MFEAPRIITQTTDRDKLLDQVKLAIQMIGLPYVNTVKILAHLKNEQGVEVLPSKTSIQKILKQDFGLRYRPTNAANIKYNDPDYDEKRRWVSRLLA